MSKAEEVEQEAKWQAESDANTLAEAEVIKADEKRLASAQKEAGNMAKDRSDSAKAMQRIAKFYGKTKGAK